MLVVPSGDTPLFRLSFDNPTFLAAFSQSMTVRIRDVTISRVVCLRFSRCLSFLRDRQHFAELGLLRRTLRLSTIGLRVPLGPQSLDLCA